MKRRRRQLVVGLVWLVALLGSSIVYSITDPAGSLEGLRHVAAAVFFAAVFLAVVKVTTR